MLLCLTSGQRKKKTKEKLKDKRFKCSSGLMEKAVDKGADRPSSPTASSRSPAL